LNAQQVRLTLEAGAQFAVSPGLTPGIADACAQARLPLLPGVATASDIMLGLERGYHRFKFFPAESSGGVPALKAFAGPFGEVRFCPTGGINPENAKSYLSLSNVICVGGSWLAPRALVEGQDWAAITALARAATELRA
jgi:2-dehydro-3-deoxyphosphogluconate aldolase/(4S)-4-hydroxy-2-oxoglutarate aldolase